ncbi:Fc.00g012510.m01.CDS01 [Cosmosporella sp. VM-42]
MAPPSIRTQFFPPAPTFTETSLPSLSSRIYIITGATTGIGFELAQILYSRSATVYIATRNAGRIASSIQALKSAFPESTGRLESLVLDLSDLTSIAPAARYFKEKESRLDGLVLNAGVMIPPEGSQSKQKHELQMGTNCLGGYLLMRSLEEVLVNTTRIAEKGTVRVVWLASTLQISTPEKGIIWDDEKSQPKVLKSQMENYKMSKVGNAFFARETAKRLGSEGVMSVCVNPGFLKTELQRNMPGAVSFVMGVVFKPAKYGAYGELFGLLSPEVTAEKNGAFIIPWGRFSDLPVDVEDGCKDKENGGTGLSKQFVEWCEKETKDYM